MTTARLAEIDRQISEARLRIQEQRQLKLDLQLLEGEIAKMRQNVADLALLLEKEAQDVYKLEDATLSNLFYSLMGSKDDKLRQEEAEYFEVEAQYESTLEALAIAKYQASLINQRLIEMIDPSWQYDQLMDEKAGLLAERSEFDKELLVGLAQDMADVKPLVRSLVAILDCGRPYLAQLNKLLALFVCGR